MKALNVLAIILLGSTISSFSLAKSSSTYTKLESCQRVEEGPDSSVTRCPNQKAYQLFLYYGDSRDWLVIKKNDRIVIDLQNDIFSQAPGNFPEIPGPIEWRSKDNLVNAIIFRVFGSNGSKKKSKLFVIRLGNKACLLGTTTSNEQARKIADSNKVCR